MLGAAMKLRNKPFCKRGDVVMAALKALSTLMTDVSRVLTSTQWSTISSSSTVWKTFSRAVLGVAVVSNVGLVGKDVECDELEYACGGLECGFGKLERTLDTIACLP